MTDNIRKMINTGAFVPINVKQIAKAYYRERLQIHGESMKAYKETAEKKTQEQLKADILLDPDYINMKKTLVDYDVKYHQAKTSYQNKMTEISLLQSELKRELSFVAKESK